MSATASSAPEPALTSDTAVSVRLSRDAEARTWVEVPERIAEWETLRSNCPWATVFQSASFARIWYGTYASRYEPVVAAGRDSTGRLVGILALARERSTGALVHVGAHHAEYQTWLLHADDRGRFLAEALARCRAELGAERLAFMFGAPGTPAPSSAVLASRDIAVQMTTFRRGRMTLGPGSAAQTSLGKKKNRLNRLERLGPVTLRQLLTSAELEQVLETIAVQCDVRQGAINAATPFLSDPLKGPFYLALMTQPGLMHATVLEAGGQIVASHIGPINGSEVVLGLITHSPAHAAYSPGTLLILLLGRLLGEQGFTGFDLTPGGGYKDRFTTEFDEVPAFEFFLEPRAARVARLRRRAARAAKKGCTLAGLDPSQTAARARTLVEGARRVNPRTLPAKLARLAARKLWSTGEYRVYRVSRRQAAAGEVPTPFRVNEPADLLCYKPVAAGDPSLTTFLREALKRLEQGQRVYTLVEAGTLLHYSWMIPATDRCGSDFGHEFRLAPGSSVLWDDYTHPIARGRGLHQQSLRRRMADAALMGEQGDIVIGVRADNGPSRHNIEKVGFRHFASGWIRVRFGRTHRWVVQAGE